MWQQSRILFAGGEDTKTDPRLVPAESLTTLENGWHRQDGALEKRPGYAVMSRSLLDGSSIASGRQIASLGGELCVLGIDRLFAWSPTAAAWIDRGWVSPCVGTQTTVFDDARDWRLCDIETDGVYALHVGSSVEGVDAAASSYGITVRVATPTGQIIHPPAMLESSNVAVARPHSGRACRATGKLFAVYVRSSAVPADIRVIGEFVTSTPGVAPSVVSTLLTGNAYTVGANVRTFDCCPLVSGKWALAWIDRLTTKITVERRNPDHTLGATITFGPNTPYRRVAIAEGATNGKLLVLAYQEAAGPAGPAVEVFGLDLATWLLDAWSPTNLLNVAGGESVPDLGIASITAALAVGVWTVWNAGTDRRRVQRHTIDPTTGAVVGDLATIHNAAVWSRPFAIGGRAYAALISANKTQAISESYIVVDLRRGEAGASDAHRTVAMHSLGRAEVAVTPPASAGFGSAQTVASYTSTRLAYTAMERSRTDLSGAASAGIHAASEVSLDLAPLYVAMIDVQQRGALIGGGRLTWYDGQETTEFGCAWPPEIDTVSDSGAAGGVPVGTHVYSTHWERVDARGVYHRSATSKPKSVVVGGAPHVVTVDVRSLPALRSVASVRAAIYRDSSTTSPGIAYRVSLSSTQTVNRQTDAVCVQFSDSLPDAQRGEAIYTTGGILDAMPSEGMQLGAVVRDRVYLARGFRGSRCAWSKVFVPSAAGEQPVAPELNDGLGAISPSGEEFTGVAWLDDKVAFFTAGGVYVLAGRGPDDAGRNDDFSGLVLQTTDVGCIEPRSVVTYGDGVLFQSARGIYLMGRSLEATYIGAPVEGLLATYPVITSAVHHAARNLCLFTATTQSGDAGIILVYEYRNKAWAHWNVVAPGGIADHAAFVSACIHDGRYHALLPTGMVCRFDETLWLDDGNYYPLVIETAWLQPAGPQGQGVARAAYALLGRANPHDLTVRVARDFSASYAQTKTWTAAEIASFPGLPREQCRVRLQPAAHRGQAWRVRVEDARAAPTAGRLRSAVESFPVVLADGDTFTGKVDGGAAATLTIVGTASRTATQFAALMNATFAGSTTTVNGDNSVTWASNVTGVASSVQFTGGTGIAKIAGFDLALHSGAASATTTGRGYSIAGLLLEWKQRGAAEELGAAQKG